MPAKSGREEMPASGSSAPAILLVEIVEQNSGRSGQFGAGRKTHHADLIGIDVPFLGIGAHQTDGLQSVVHGVDLRIVTVAAQAISKNDRVDSVVVEKRNEIGAFAADVQGLMTAARNQDHRRAGVEAAIHRMHFDRRIVNVDDAVDPPRNALAHVVLLGFANPRGVQEMGVRRIERNHDAAR